MRIVCFADTHGGHMALDIPECDVLIFAGDYSRYGKEGETEEFAAWMERQPAEHKLVIAGNHDEALEKNPVPHEAILKKHGLTYLRDSGVRIDGLLFYGSPWQPEFNNWAFNLPRKSMELHDKWDAIPSDTDILITHGPPHGYGDKNIDGEHCGCELLLEALDRVKPKYHIFGHIHEGRGTYNRGPSSLINGTVLDENYNLKYQPVVMEYKFGKDKR